MEKKSGANPALAKAEPVARLGPSGFDPGELLALAERCELAASADREIDAEIGAIPAAEFLGFPVGKQPGCQAFTASLDAAMTLVPDGWRWCRYSWPRTDERHEITLVSVGEVAGGRGSTPALALCAAALRALAPTDTRSAKT